MLERLLARTSRTFALAIPLLPEPPRHEVGLAYLLLRVADTLEDARWPRTRRAAELAELAELLTEREPAEAHARAGQVAARWLIDPPSEQSGYLELLRETPALIAELGRLPAARRGLVLGHVLRTVAGMRAFVEGSGPSGELQIEHEQELQRYCYVVAGIVGELLTELFLEVVPELAPVGQELRARAAAFGEGLQLVNILKDAERDAEQGRRYVPRTSSRARVLALARADLDLADGYVAILRAAAAPPGICAFCAFPVGLARLTLDAIERSGAGAKVGRDAVLGLLSDLSSPAELARVLRLAGAR